MCERGVPTTETLLGHRSRRKQIGVGGRRLQTSGELGKRPLVVGADEGVVIALGEIRLGLPRRERPRMVDRLARKPFSLGRRATIVEGYCLDLGELCPGGCEPRIERDGALAVLTLVAAFVVRRGPKQQRIRYDVFGERPGINCDGAVP